MIEAHLVEAPAMAEQLIAWSILLGLLIVALTVGGWREEQRRRDEDAERRRKVREEFGDADP